MPETEVVTCFLLRRDSSGDQLLLLRRSQRVLTYRGRWASVSGYLEAASPLEQARLEVREETGLSGDDIRLLAEGEPLPVVDDAIGVRWRVHPFLFEVLQPERIRLDWEHVEARWLPPEQLGELETVPGLAEALARVYPPPAS